MMLLTAPVRAAWSVAGPDVGVEDVGVEDVGVEGGGPRRLPELLSLSLATGLAAFFLLYASAFLRPGIDQVFVRLPEDAPGHEAAEVPAVLTLTSYLVTTALVVVPLLLLARRGRLPRGAASWVVVPVVWLSVALADFERLEIAVAVTVAVGLLDLLLPRLDALPPALRLPVLGAALPAAVWPAQVLAVAVTDGIRYPVALWTGVLVLTVLTGSLLGGLARPTARP